MRTAWLVVAAACSGSPAAAPDAARDAPGVDAAATHYVAYVGGYTSELARLDVARDTGALASAQTTPAFAADPSFLAFDPAGAHLYAVSESTDQVGAYSIDRATGALAFLGAQPSGGSGPAYLTVDPTGAYVLVANYGDGKVGVLAIQPGGGLGAAQAVTAGANAHEVVIDPSRRYAFVPCLGSDWVAQYTFDATTGALAPNAVPHLATAAGAGPRHLAFSPDGRFAYLIAEKASTVTTLALDGATGRLAPLQTVSTLPPGFSGSNTGAEVWVHPSGAYVLASNRGDDSLAVFARDGATGMLTPLAYPKTGGTTPRDFTLDPAGRFVYVANQGSSSVTAFAFDAATGALSPIGTPVTSTMPTFVGLVALSAP